MGLLGEILVLLLVEVFSVEVWENLLEFFYAFLEVQTALVVEFHGVIHDMEESQKMGLNNVWLKCDSTLVCVAFTTPWMLHNQWNICLNYFGKIKLDLGLLIFFVKRMRVLICFVINGILILITVGKLGLRLLIFFVKSWLILDLFIENLFIGIIDFHLFCS